MTWLITISNPPTYDAPRDTTMLRPSYIKSSPEMELQSTFTSMPLAPPLTSQLMQSTPTRQKNSQGRVFNPNQVLSLALAFMRCSCFRFDLTQLFQFNMTHFFWWNLTPTTQTLFWFKWKHVKVSLKSSFRESHIGYSILKIIQRQNRGIF